MLIWAPIEIQTIRMKLSVNKNEHFEYLKILTIVEMFNNYKEDMNLRYRKMDCKLQLDNINNRT